MPSVGELTPMGYGRESCYVVYGHVEPVEFVEIVLGWDPSEKRVLAGDVRTGIHGRWVPAIDEETGRPSGGMAFTVAGPGRGAFPATYWEPPEWSRR